MKKLLILFLSVVAVFSAFAGGGSAGGATGKTSRVGAKGSLPLATNKPVLTLFMPGAYADNLTSFDYKDNVFTKKIVDETGIDLRITSTNAADAQERLNIMLSTGDYPDIVFAHYGTVDMDYYAKQGIFIPLDQYDPLSYPLIKRVFDMYPAAKEKITGSDGKIYSMPYIDVCLHCEYQYGRIWYNMPWIRDNGRKAPETLTEFTEFLRWAKNTDLNKNGKKDEVGLVFSKDDLYNIVAYFAKAHMPFVYTGQYFGLSLGSGKKVTEQYRDANFRATLAYMANLFKNGLIVEDSFSMTADQRDALLKSPETVVAVAGQAWNPYIQLSDKYMEYFMLPSLKTADGKRNASNGDPWSQIYAKYFITNKCKDPELAVALYEYFQRNDVLKDAYGPKNVFWQDPDPGTKGYDGRPAYWKWLIAFGSEPLNSHFGNASPHVWLPEMRAGLQMDDVETAIRYLHTGDKSLQAKLQQNISYSEFMWYQISVDVSKDAMPNSLFIPPLLINSADSSRVADINAVLDPFKKQAIVEFITGTRDINNNAQWNAYLSELDRLGSPEMVQILQKYVK